MSKVLMSIVAFIVIQAAFSGIFWLSYDIEREYGAKNPLESCILNVVSVFIAIFVYLRHRQVETILSVHNDINKCVVIENEIVIWLGLGACVGLNVVANFQEFYSPIIYYIAGGVWLSFGTIYIVLQGYISFHISPHSGSLRVAVLRMAISFLYLYYVFIILVTNCNFVRIWGNKHDLKECTHFGYWFKWIDVLFFNVFILSFLHESVDQNYHSLV